MSHIQALCSLWQFRYTGTCEAGPRPGAIALGLGSRMPSILREVLTMLFLYFVLSLIVVALASWLINYRIPLAATTKAILNVVLALILVGMFLWLINTYIPMAGVIKVILNIVVVVATCV